MSSISSVSSTNRAPAPPKDEPAKKIEGEGTDSNKIEGTDGDDTIDVSKVGEDQYKVTVTNSDDPTKNQEHILTGEQLKNTQINAGAGDDTVRVGDDVTVGINFDLGDGNDSAFGGAGDDTIHGGSGHDVISGGAGFDFITGGSGSDALYADKDDTVYTGSFTGGVHNLHLDEQSEEVDEDTVVAHAGATVHSGDNSVVIKYSEADHKAAEKWLSENATVEGSSGFKSMTTQNMAALFATEQGRALIGSLEQSIDNLSFNQPGVQVNGKVLTFVELEGVGGSVDLTNDPDATREDPSLFGLTIGVGNSTEASRHDDSTSPPVAVMFHELVHAWQLTTGNPPEGRTGYDNGVGTANSEASATGLPWMDENGDLHNTNDDNRSPFSENQFRAEVGLELREGYSTSPVGNPASYTNNAPLQVNEVTREIVTLSTLEPVSAVDPDLEQSLANYFVALLANLLAGGSSNKQSPVKNRPSREKASKCPRNDCIPLNPKPLELDTNQPPS